jgi:hypothetical protein
MIRENMCGNAALKNQAFNQAVLLFVFPNYNSVSMKREKAEGLPPAFSPKAA